ncbi:hypothetical protein FE783_36935 [Paenibacillus mesophilus]|uniref:hypothetical protein n=1 Tax=Paenibacillus mesophilus TaxID=2582849 RepID=UPI00110E000D|nr:hypothetical protein [Paenibacillus mesophilus]TMV42801.1 hypothetical protein FE783_36935 [Paenibacillus mesophilus]
MFQKVKGMIFKSKAAFTMVCMAIVAMLAAVPASAAPATGNTDVDSFLTEFETGFGVVNKGFVYLAIGSIVITLVVVAFFWLRGKFKQSVAGA